MTLIIPGSERGTWERRFVLVDWLGAARGSNFLGKFLKLIEFAFYLNTKSAEIAQQPLNSWLNWLFNYQGKKKTFHPFFHRLITCKSDKLIANWLDPSSSSALHTQSMTLHSLQGAGRSPTINMPPGSDTIRSPTSSLKMAGNHRPTAIISLRLAIFVSPSSTAASQYLH